MNKNISANRSPCRCLLSIEFPPLFLALADTLSHRMLQSPVIKSSSDSQDLSALFIRLLQQKQISACVWQGTWKYIVVICSTALFISVFKFNEYNFPSMTVYLVQVWCERGISLLIFIHIFFFQRYSHLNRNNLYEKLRNIRSQNVEKSQQRLNEYSDEAYKPGV